MDAKSTQPAPKSMRDGRHPIYQPVRLAGGWCWFVLREEYRWLVAGLF
jgi:hypothetical protein